jgi:hypothetical protein
MPRRGPTIAETVLRLIRERGPQSIDDLVPEVVAAGRTQARDPRRAVLAAIDAHPRFVQAWDGRWCSLVDQLDGAVFATPLTRLEQRDGIVLLRDNLALVGRLAAPSIPLASGGEVHVDLIGDYFDLPTWSRLEDDDRAMREILGPDLATDLLDFLGEVGLPPGADEDDALRELADEMWTSRILHGPDGWLPSLGRGQLLGIQVRSGAIGTVALDRREVSGPHVGLAGARVAQLAQLVLGPDASWFGPRVMSLEELLELVATEAPEVLRRPLPPFEEVVARGGLDALDGYVAHRGADWSSWARSIPLGPDAPWGYEPSRFVH